MLLLVSPRLLSCHYISGYPFGIDIIIAFLFILQKNCFWSEYIYNEEMKTRYNIEIEYWTAFQKQFAEKFLDEILNNFDTALQVHHKKNKVTITKSFEN